MEKKTLVMALEYVRLLCQVPKAADFSYIEALYHELAHLYDGDQIMVAARKICQNETLYGVFPSLSLWMKYCPAVRVEKIKDKSNTADFMEAIDNILEEDSMVFDLQHHRKMIWETFGMRASIALKEFGGVAGLRRAGFGADNYTKESLKKQVKEAWNESKQDIIPEIVTKLECESKKQIENKN